jgi:hypothetical protein
MNNTRAIIVQKSAQWPDGYIPVDNCNDCKIRQVHGKYEFSDGTNKWECSVMGEMVEPYQKDAIRRKVSPLGSVHKNCPLPLLFQVEKHPPNERPKHERDVLIKLSDSDEIIIGHYIHGWNESQTGNYIEDRLVEYWREVPQ